MTLLVNSFEGGSFPTTVAAGSNGGEISTIASWGATFGGNGVLAVASTTGFPAAGTLSIAASGPTVALVTYTGTSGGNTFTGCAYVSGSATGTIATGGGVNLGITSANSGFTSGNAFDSVGTGSSATTVFDNTHAAHGSQSAELATIGSAATYVQWTTAGSAPNVAQAWFREYLYFTANPTNQHKVWSCVNGGTAVMSVFVTTSGKLLVTYSGSGTTFVTFTASIPLGAWFRVEGFIIASATVGQVSASLYTVKDSATAAESHTSAANLNTASGNPTAYNFGTFTAVAAVGPYWMDDIALSSTGPVGPYGGKTRTRASLPAIIATM